MLLDYQSYKLYSNYLTNKFFPIEYDILFIISKYTVMPLISNDISYVSYHTKCSNIKIPESGYKSIDISNPYFP